MEEDILKVVQNPSNQDGAINTLILGMTINGLMAAFFLVSLVCAILAMVEKPIIPLC